MKSISVMFAVILMLTIAIMAIPSSNSPPGNSVSAVTVDHTFDLMENGSMAAIQIASGPSLKGLRIDNKNTNAIERPLIFDAQTNGVEPTIVIRS